MLPWVHIQVEPHLHSREAGQCPAPFCLPTQKGVFSALWFPKWCPQSSSNITLGLVRNANSRAPPPTCQSAHRVRPGTCVLRSPPGDSDERSRRGVPSADLPPPPAPCPLPSPRAWGGTEESGGWTRTGVPRPGLKGRQPLLPAVLPPAGWSPAAPPAHLQPRRWLGRAWKPSHRSDSLRKSPPVWTPRSPVAGSPRSRHHG